MAVTPNALVGRRYEVQELLGEGGMGTVYRAIDRLMGQAVALKSVGRSLGHFDFDDSQELDEFRLSLAKEFKLLASVHHPNIIKVQDYGFDSGQKPFYTMELLVNAQTILDAAQDKPLQTRLNYIVQMLRALAYLHRRGILHRDLKPANVLVIDDTVKVLDFGLSTMKDRSDAESDDPEVTAGTLAYMAPETLIGRHASEPTDLYAVGVMAYELIAGKHPFDKFDASTLIQQIMYAHPDITMLDIDLGLATVIQRLLQKDLSSRYDSAASVITDIENAANGTIVVESDAIRESYLQSARLVGRERELAQLSDALDTARAGSGSIWLIGGESGVGKSRLVDELATLGMVQGALVMRGQSVSEGRRPYQVWSQVMRWLGLLGDLDAVEAGLIQKLIPDIVTLPPADPQAAALLSVAESQTRLLNALAKLIRQQGQPVVMLFEDMHWAKSESLSMLVQFAAMMADLPVLVVITYRDDEDAKLPSLLPNASVLKLKRLGEQSIAELSEAMLGQAGKQPQVVSLLQRETEGNVFFLIEVVRTLAESAGRLEDIGLMTLPQNVFAGGVERIIQNRLSSLPEASYAYLEIAAVIGRRIDTRLLHTIEPEIRLEQWLFACSEAAILELLDGEWRFAHDKLREAVLARLSAERRSAINRRVALAIEAVYPFELQAAPLAYHWKMAEDAGKERFYTQLAGEQAVQTGAYQEALGYFNRALELIPDVDASSEQRQQIHLQYLKASALLGLGSYDEAGQIYRRNLVIAERLNDQDALARNLYALGDVAYAQSMPGEAQRYYTESLQLYQDLDDQIGLVASLNSLGNIAYELGDEKTAKEFYQRSMKLSREIGQQWGMAGSVTTMETHSVDANNHQENLARITETLEIHLNEDNRQGIAEALVELARNALQAEDYQEAEENLGNALKIRRELGDLTGVAAILELLGVVNAEVGRLGVARKYLQEALQTAHQSGKAILCLHVLVSFASFQIVNQQKTAALEILAFLLHHEATPDTLHDQAEQMVFGLEADMLPEAIEVAWERGKTFTLESLITSITGK